MCDGATGIGRGETEMIWLGAAFSDRYGYTRRPDVRRRAMYALWHGAMAMDLAFLTLHYDGTTGRYGFA